MDTLFQLILLAIGIYAALGLLFALPFVARGVNVIDAGAGGGTRGFRLLIVPGVVALWPFLLRRWLKREKPPAEWTPHRHRVSR